MMILTLWPYAIAHAVAHACRIIEPTGRSPSRSGRSDACRPSPAAGACSTRSPSSPVGRSWACPSSAPTAGARLSRGVSTIRFWAYLDQQHGRQPRAARQDPPGAGGCDACGICLEFVESEDAMLVRALYVSRAVGPQTGTVTARILAASEAHNAAHAVSGVLCQGQGLYLQVLEGERAEVNRLYAHILQDRRHRDVQLLSFEEITERRYPDWSMAHVVLPDDDAMVRMRLAAFDPYSAPGAVVLQLVDELLASGHRIAGAKSSTPAS
jgi:hypothetical protein